MTFRRFRRLTRRKSSGQVRLLRRDHTGDCRRQKHQTLHDRIRTTHAAAPGSVPGTRECRHVRMVGHKVLERRFARIDRVMS